MAQVVLTRSSTWADGSENNILPPSHPELSTQGAWDSKSKRHDYDRFDDQSMDGASIGGAMIGKVDVDCKFRFKKSKWGYLNGKTPAAIIYLDLDFNQPVDCRLVWAKVRVVLREFKEDPSSPSAPASAKSQTQALQTQQQCPAQMTEYFGPKDMVRAERIEHREDKLSMQPEFEAAGFGLGGVGPVFNKSYELSHRWNFTGRLVNSHKKTTRAASPGGSSLYRTLEWSVTENCLESGQGNCIHTAFTFLHDGGELLMDVSVEGKLESKSERVKAAIGKLNFGSSERRPGDTATTRVGKYRGERAPLISQARILEGSMVWENCEKRPIQLGGPRDAADLFQSHYPTPSHPNASVPGPSQTLPAQQQATGGPSFLLNSASPLAAPQHHYHQHTHLPEFPSQTAANEQLEASLRELFAAAQTLLAKPPRESIRGRVGRVTRVTEESPSTSTRRSISPTLVGERTREPSAGPVHPELRDEEEEPVEKEEPKDEEQIPVATKQSEEDPWSIVKKASKGKKQKAVIKQEPKDEGGEPVAKQEPKAERQKPVMKEDASLPPKDIPQVVPFHKGLTDDPDLQALLIAAFSLWAVIYRLMHYLCSKLGISQTFSAEIRSLK